MCAPEMTGFAFKVTPMWLASFAFSDRVPLIYRLNREGFHLNRRQASACETLRTRRSWHSVSMGVSLLSLVLPAWQDNCNADIPSISGRSQCSSWETQQSFSLLAVLMWQLIHRVGRTSIAKMARKVLDFALRANFTAAKYAKAVLTRDLC